MRATEENKKFFEAQRAQLEAENLKRREEAEAVGSKMDGLSVILIRQAGDAGQLYGSVNARDVAEGVTEAGFTVGRNQVELEQPIKTLGMHAVRVKLHSEVSVTVTANVARSKDEAETQAATGRAVLSSVEEERLAEAEAAEAAAAAAAEVVVEAAEAVFEEEAVEQVVADAEAEVEAAADDAEEAKDA